MERGQANLVERASVSHMPYWSFCHFLSRTFAMEKPGSLPVLPH
jgi:hypothetical protein